jgi:hypothetical protein
MHDVEREPEAKLREASALPVQHCGPDHIGFACMGASVQAWWRFE